MQYCPNCSAYQNDQDAQMCRKCGCDLSLLKEKVTTIPKEDLPKKRPDPTFDPQRPCKQCHSPTRAVEGEVEIPIEGQRISIQGLKLMGSEITKKVVTQITYTISGYECKDGHKFYRSVSSRVRPSCPVCYHPMINYGSSLLSCTRCNKHFPSNEWPDPDPVKTLHQEGWEPI